MKKVTLASCLLLSACSGLSPELEEALKSAQGPIAPSTTDSMNATREALVKGVLTGISKLHSKGGFASSHYRILIPKDLRKATDLAREIGLGSKVDAFERSLNSAAEQAVAAAAPVFEKNLRNLTFTDIVSILTGSDQAATDYFRRSSSSDLVKSFRPIVAKATAQNDVGRLYKQLATTLKPAATLAGLSLPMVDLDEYVTEKAVAALFDEIGHQEQLIRQNPVERTTALMQTVFGYYSR
jgi:hypothetical protein